MKTADNGKKNLTSREKLFCESARRRDQPACHLRPLRLKRLPNGSNQPSRRELWRAAISPIGGVRFDRPGSGRCRRARSASQVLNFLKDIPGLPQFSRVTERSLKVGGTGGGLAGFVQNPKLPKSNRKVTESARL